MYAIKKLRTLAAVLIFALPMYVVHADKLDPRTLCPTSGSKGQTILLLDITNPLTPVAQERLKQLLMGFGDDGSEHYLPRGHELIAYYLSPKISSMNKPIMRVCNPGNPNDRTFIDDLVGSVIEARKKWKIFEQRRKYIWDAAQKQAYGKKSPLLEGIAVMSARHIQNQKRKSTRLLLFSDMLQNSKHLSHYKSLPTMKKFKSLTGFSEMDADLNGVDVWIFYIRRTNLEDQQTTKHYYWWTEAIDALGGRLMEQIPL